MCAKKFNSRMFAVAMFIWTPNTGEEAGLKVQGVFLVKQKHTPPVITEDSRSCVQLHLLACVCECACVSECTCMCARVGVSTQV